MSEIVKAQESKPATRRGRKAKETAQEQQSKTVKIEASPVAVEAEDTGEGAGLVQAAVQVADMELHAAVEAYNARTAQNASRLFGHIRNTQLQVGQQIRQQLHASYGINPSDIYADEPTDQPTD